MNQFPERKFYNRLKGELKGRVEIVDESHKRFIEKMAEGPVVGIQFFPLQGFSINADRELMPILPKCLHLSGSVDIATAMTAYQDILTCDINTPGYDCAAVSWKLADFSLYFSANDTELMFSHTGVHSAFDIYSGGLVFLE